MNTTVVPDTLNYLVTLFKNAPTIGGANPPVEVIDGPMPSSGPIPLALWVGVDDLPAAVLGDATTAATSDKQLSDFALGRQEQITISCVAAAWTGSVKDGYSPLRAAAAAIVKAAEAVVTADTGAPPQAQIPGVTSGQWWQRPFEGLQVFVPFQIVYLAL